MLFSSYWCSSLEVALSPLRRGGGVDQATSTHYDLYIPAVWFLHVLIKGDCVGHLPVVGVGGVILLVAIFIVVVVVVHQIG